MGRPTLAAQIAKAAAEGDIEKVKELAARLDKNKDKKPKPKSKTKKRKSPSKVEVYEEEVYQADDIDEQPEPPNMKKGWEDFIAKAKDPDKTQTYIDKDGNERVRAKVVPFKVVKNRKNKWKDEEPKNEADIKFDKLVRKNGSTARQYRAPTTKVRVKCSRCKQEKIVWPGEVFYRNWVCDDCLANNKRG